MIYVILIILIITLVMVFHSIYILKKKLFKDFIVCSIIYIIGLVYSISAVLESDIIQPTKVVEWVFKPIAKIVFGKVL